MLLFLFIIIALSLEGRSALAVSADASQILSANGLGAENLAKPLSSIGQQAEDTAGMQISVGLRAEISQTQEKCAVLTWMPAAGAVSYEVQRAAAEDAPFDPIGMISEAGITSYTDSDLIRSHSYYYRVAVRMGDGSICYSETVNFICPLNKVVGVSIRRFSSSSVKLAWKKNKNAGCYRILVAKGSPSRFRCVGTTKNTKYRVKKLHKNKKYYFQIQACAARRSSSGDGTPSEAVSMRMKKYRRTIVFAGDSITTGLNSYHTIQKMKIGGRKKVVAAIGLNTTTFRTRRCFGGQSGLRRVISYHPYRLYMMLGINEIHYRSSSDVLAGYRDLIDNIKAQSPETEIILLAVSPVTKAQRNQREGFWQIPKLNKKLKKLAKRKHMKYFDYTGFLKESDGYLKEKYAVADGVHWNAAGYDQFGRVMSRYDRSLD